MSTLSELSGFLLMGAGAAFRQELCEMIAETQLFADADWNDINALAGYVQCYQVPAGTAVFEEGDAGDYMCLVVSGQIEILKEDSEGKRHRIVMMGRGKTIGEMSIIDGEPRSATCIAAQDSVLILLTKDSYARISRERAVLALHILAKLAKLMSQRLRGLSGQLVEFLDQPEHPDDA